MREEWWGVEDCPEDDGDEEGEGDDCGVEDGVEGLEIAGEFCEQRLLLDSVLVPGVLGFARCIRQAMDPADEKVER